MNVFLIVYSCCESVWNDEVAYRSEAEAKEFIKSNQERMYPVSMSIQKISLAPKSKSK